MVLCIFFDKPKEKKRKCETYSPAFVVEIFFISIIFFFFFFCCKTRGNEFTHKFWKYFYVLTLCMGISSINKSFLFFFFSLFCFSYNLLYFSFVNIDMDVWCYLWKRFFLFCLGRKLAEASPIIPFILRLIFIYLFLIACILVYLW